MPQLLYYPWQKLVLLGHMVALALAAQAQETQLHAPADSAGRRAVPRLAHARFVALYDARYSFLEHQLYRVNGVRMGVEFRNRLQVGGAFYLLNSAAATSAINPAGADPTTASIAVFGYVAGYAEYVMLETRRWELSATTQLGLGKAFVLYTALNGQEARTSPNPFGLIEPSALAQYKILHWLGVGAGLGWRQPVFVSSGIQSDLSGPVFHLRGKLFLGTLIKTLHKREGLFSHKGLRKE